MDKGNASWEQVHRILFPGGPVPVSLLDASSHLGAGLLGPSPGMKISLDGPQDFGNSLGPRPPPPRPPPDPRLLQRREENFHFFAIPPPVPRDPKMLHHIKLFAAFVAKFGVENESLVRAKQQGKSEFSFLYGGEPGSEASIGLHYYEWQKEVMLKVLEARKAVSEGKIPPDRLKSMQRELEQCLQGIQPLKDFRIEAIIGLPENGKLDWHKIALEVGVTLPGDRRGPPVEPHEMEKKTSTSKAPPAVKPVGDVPSDPRRSNKTDRPRGAGRRDEKDAKEDPRRKRRSRSRSQERDRHRHRSPPRSPPHRNHSPRRRGRSHSRSPRRRERFPSPRRGNDRKRDADDRKDDNKITHHHHPQERLLPLEALPFANQHVGQMLVPPPATMEPPPGFVAAVDNVYGRYISPPPVLDPAPPQQHLSFASNTQEPGLVRAFPQVGPAFAPNLSEIPVQQQQFLLQQLQLSQMQGNMNGTLGPPSLPAPPPAMAMPGLPPPPPPLAPSNWPSSGEVLPVEVPPHFVGIVGQAPPQIFVAQQSPLPLPPQQQHVVSADKYDPLQPTSSNDVEMEVEDAKAADEEPEVVNSKLEVLEAKAVESSAAAAVAETSKRSSLEKEQQQHKEEENGGEESEQRVQKEKGDKDGRALKIVRNTVAEFVKELLNPKWRDGILSKDDFKVIAQKAVNKVVGNLQGSQIPKGTERVDRFMASSKDKITKLVQEYVEKHTKNAPASSSATAPIAEEEDDDDAT